MHESKHAFLFSKVRSVAIQPKFLHRDWNFFAILTAQYEQQVIHLPSLIKQGKSELKRDLSNFIFIKANG